MKHTPSPIVAKARKYKAGDRVRYIGDFNPEYQGKEGEVVSVGQNTALIRFDGLFLKFHCSQERLEALA